MLLLRVISITIFSLFLFFTGFSQIDSSGFVVISSIEVKGNKKTKSYIVERELTFNLGDSIYKNVLKEKLERSRQNLLNTSLFNFVTIRKVHVNPTEIKIFIEVIERWYLWPALIFELAETNFNSWWVNKDLSRLSYGFAVTKDNFRGRKEKLGLKVQLGFTEQLGLQYTIPYINKKRTNGLGITASYSGNHEINYRSLGNKRIFLKDTEKYLRTEFISRLTFIQRLKLYETTVLELEYTNSSLADTITTISNDYFSENSQHTQFLALIFKYSVDKRDFAAYPLKGSAFGIDIVKYGLGLLNNDKLNTVMLSFNLRKHFHLKNRWFFASGIFSKSFLLNNPPYYIQQGLGYRDYVRGYELYVIDGQQYGLLRNNLKYQLVKQKQGKVNIIPTEKFNTFHYAFYLNAFLDIGYTSDQLYFRENKLSNEVLVGGGIGLDFVTYYDKVVRMELSLNRMRELGFYLHFRRPI